MNLIFCGTPDFAVPTLERLLQSGFNVRLVVTQPDRPRGRGMEFAPSPVKQAAERLRLPVVQPERIKTNDAFRAQIEAVRPQAIIVVGYGRLIPPWMIALPPLGNINLHASLLPKYRGAAPVQWAIALGETTTGVTTMRIDEGLDTGGILLRREEPIAPEDTALTLAPRLAVIGAELMIETLRALETGSLQPRPQDHAHATLARLLTKEDGRIDFSRSAVEIHNRVRGFQPWPGQSTRFRGRQLRLWKTRVAAGETAPGEFKVEGERLLVGCGGGAALEVLELQPEGKRRMSAREFISGYRPKDREKLGD